MKDESILQSALTGIGGSYNNNTTDWGRVFERVFYGTRVQNRINTKVMETVYAVPPESGFVVGLVVGVVVGGVVVGSVVGIVVGFGVTTASAGHLNLLDGRYGHSGPKSCAVGRLTFFPKKPM